MPHAISLNLISLVSRFEALDALSLPFKHSSLQPASLRVSQKISARRVEKSANHCTKLSTILIPTANQSPQEYSHVMSEDEPTSGRDDVFISSSSTLRFSPEKPIMRYVRKAQTCRQPSTTRLRGGDWDTIQAMTRNRAGINKAFNEVPNNKDERRSIRDIIRLYDGGEPNSSS
jgi:hypothetical protein